MKSMRSLVVVAAATVVVFLGGIQVSRALGWWQTENARVPARISTGTYAGVYDPADIRGSSTLGSIAEFYGVGAADIAAAFGIETDNPEVITANTVDSVYGEVTGPDGTVWDVGTDAVKLFVSLMSGIPYESEPETGLPAAAIDAVLSSGVVLSDAQRADMLRREIASRVIAVADIPVEEHTTVEPTTGVALTEIQGRTTFGEVLAAGLTAAQIESVLGMPMGARTMSVRDFALDKGLSYGTVRTGLLELLAKSAAE